MKVKDLIAKLSLEDQDATVVLSSDPEGNSISEMQAIDDGVWDGGVYFSSGHSAEDNCLEEKEWEELKRNKNLAAVLLWPK